MEYKFVLKCQVGLVSRKIEFLSYKEVEYAGVKAQIYDWLI